MTPARQPHPERCETCTNLQCHDHPNNNFWKSEERKNQIIIQQEFTARNGCATHSSTPAPDGISWEERCSIAYQSGIEVGTEEGAKDERGRVLDRLDKEIAIREHEMNRKATLEDNLEMAAGYLVSAGALNWIRVVLIDGLRESLRSKQEEQG